jgi:hypothetical protein
VRAYSRCAVLIQWLAQSVSGFLRHTRFLRTDIQAKLCARFIQSYLAAALRTACQGFSGLPFLQGFTLPDCAAKSIQPLSTDEVLRLTLYSIQSKVSTPHDHHWQLALPILLHCRTLCSLQAQLACMTYSEICISALTITICIYKPQSLETCQSSSSCLWPFYF